MEYSIGDFSRISRLGIKTLRYYHEIGLLVPSRIDRLTGYRYYNETLLERVRLILKLKNLNFSLDEIKELLENKPDAAELVKLFERKINDLDEKISEYKQIQTRLQGFLVSEKNLALNIPSSSAVKEILLPEMFFVASRFQGRYEEIGEHLEQLFAAYGNLTIGYSFSLYYDNSSMIDQEADIEVCLPIRAGSVAPEIACRRLAEGRALSIIHTGPYENLYLSYQLIVNALYQRTQEVILPVREIYRIGPNRLLPGDPNQFQTEIQFMLS